MKIQNGKTVNVHYVGTLKDGTVFDSSHQRGKPMTFQVGGSQILPAFESAITSMSVGEKKKFSLTPEEAYGYESPNAIHRVPRNQFGNIANIEVGHYVTGENPDGDPMHAVVDSIEEETITLNFNHPLAGKDIIFDVELLSVD